MRPPIPGKRPPAPDMKLSDAQSIDAQFGLEPVIDTASSADGNAATDTQFYLVECPYCGESFETSVDTSSGSARYVEDCQICCQPIEFSLEVDHAGLLQSLSTVRGD
jgi:Cysteine-rich CPXCG